MFGIIKRRRSLDEVGKEQFNFVYADEKYIYARLCKTRISKKKIRSEILEKEIGSYKEWKQYIDEKYAQYDKEQLIEFSRYLNLRLRKTKPDQEIWNIVLSVALTLFIDKTYEMWDEISKTETPEKLSFEQAAGLLFASILAIVTTVVFIWKVLAPIFNANLEKNMFLDYKEIIDARIKELEELEERKRLDYSMNREAEYGDAEDME